MQKGAYKDRLGVVIAIRQLILCDVKLARPVSGLHELVLDMPGNSSYQLSELKIFIISEIVLWSCKVSSELKTARRKLSAPVRFRAESTLRI